METSGGFPTCASRTVEVLFWCLICCSWFLLVRHCLSWNKALASIHRQDLLTLGEKCALFYQPWVGCDHGWNTDNCLVYNSSNPNATGVSSSREFLIYHVLKISEGIDQPGPLNTPVTLCLLAAWVLVYFCIWKGVKTTGKVVYITATAPYIILIVFFFRGITLPGAKNGIIFYLIPSFTRLSDPKVWIDAATQILYSLALGLGVHLTFASYNPRNNNILRDSMIIAITNCVTSVFAGLVIFSVVGFMAHEMKKSVEDVASQGPGLAFIVYPAAIAQMPFPQIWAVLFFMMLIMLGLDSQFGQVEIVASVIVEHFEDKLGRYRELVVLAVCAVLFLLGLSCVSHGGIYVFNLFDSMSAGLSLLFIVMAEMIVVAWIYGADRFAKQIEEMTGRRVCRWWVWCWKYITLVLVVGIFLFSLVKYQRVKYEDYVYPPWAEAVGWMIALASMLWIPGVALVKVVRLYCQRDGPDKKVLFWCLICCSWFLLVCRCLYWNKALASIHRQDLLTLGEKCALFYQTIVWFITHQILTPLESHLAESS